MAFWKLRQMSSRAGDTGELELDVEQTVSQTGSNANVLKLAFRPCRKNSVRLLMLLILAGQWIVCIALYLTISRISRSIISTIALEATIKYVGKRVSFGRPIAKLQGLQWYLADMATNTEAAKALVFKVACVADT